MARKSATKAATAAKKKTAATKKSKKKQTSPLNKKKTPPQGELTETSSTSAECPSGEDEARNSSAQDKEKPSTLNPLPPQPHGPSIFPFNNGKPVKIEYIMKVEESGIQSSVYQVKIEGKIYAVKIFKFIDWKACYSDFRYPYSNPLKAPSEEYLRRTNFWPPEAYYTCAPFFRECRAYGRLKEIGKEDMAIRAHGYLLLDKKHEELLRDRFADDEWDRDDIDPKYFDPDQPLQAIVKDWIDSGIKFTHRMASQMIRDLTTYHRSGIIVNDVKYDNYLQGKVVDFGSATTIPHFDMDERFVDYGAITCTAYEDWRNLRNMFEWWNAIAERKGGQRIWTLTHCNMDYKEKLRGSPKSDNMLRPNPLTYGQEGKVEKYYIDTARGRGLRQVRRQLRKIMDNRRKNLVRVELSDLFN